MENLEDYERLEIGDILTEIVNTVCFKETQNDTCSECQMNWIAIQARGSYLKVSKVYGRTIDDLSDDSLKICKSCVSSTKKCIDCGLSEAVMFENMIGESDGTTHDPNYVFKENHGAWPPEYRCPDCFERYRRYNIQSHLYDDILYACQYCGKDWDGYSQCPCALSDTYYGEYSEEVEVDVALAADVDEDSKVVIQDNLIELINTIYEIKNDISEGVYLKIMNNIKHMNDTIQLKI